VLFRKQNIHYGLSGDGKSFAMNPIRDTISLGNGELYHGFGQVFTLTTGVFIPIAQTKSIAQGFSQFFWGTVGSIATGQAAYHGTKLLGGSEETAQLMNLLGNFVGGYKFSKIAENFSLNTIRVPKVESALEIENLVLENIKASKTAREYSNFKDFAIRERYLEKILDKLTPEERELIFSISKNAPKVEYRPGKTAKSVLSIPKKERPSVEQVYSSEYRKAHRQQFENGASRFQKYPPSESWNGGIVGGDDGTSFWMSKEHADILEKVAKGDNRLYEILLGLDEGYLGDGPLYRLDATPEVVAEKGISIPSGKEAGANDLWRPTGRIFPAGIPEGVMKDISTKRGEHTWNIVN